MKVFISQPMNGLTEGQIQTQEAIVEKWLKDKFNKDIIAVSGYTASSAPNELSSTQIPIWYLSKSIEKLAQCDAIFLVNGWQKYRGCVLEYEIAQTYGMPIIVQKVPKNG